MTPHLQKQLIEESEKQIYKIAHKYSKYYDIEDLYQAGVVGLLIASRTYDFSSNTKFMSYAYPFILGEIISHIKKDRSIKVNDNYITIYKMYEKSKNILTNSLEREPTFKEIADFMKIEEHTLLQIIESTLFTKSIENDEYELNNNYFVDERTKVEERILIKSAMEQLNDFDKNIIDYRYFHGYSQSETAEALGISQVKVSRQEKLILSKMKQKVAA